MDSARLVKVARLALWRAFSLCARVWAALLPADETQLLAARRLRDETSKLPEAPASNSAAQQIWIGNQRRLRRLIAARDARTFLIWDVIRETMVIPPFARFICVEADFLQSHDWNRWRRAIAEHYCMFRVAGMVRSSSTAMHLANHLCYFETQTGLRLTDFAMIFEFGGGYGSLCRVVHGAGFTGRYVIFDLPEQCALQRYYLSLNGLDAVKSISTIEDCGQFGAGRRLFIATWSLSESPFKLRRRIADSIAGFDAFLIAYQERFADLDNDDFFAQWQSWFPGVHWITSNIEHMPGNRYLLGYCSQPPPKAL